MLPVMLDVARLRVALAGDGPEALGRLKLLDAAGCAHLTVFAPEPGEELAGLAGARLMRRLPEARELEAIDILFLADLEETPATALTEAARAARCLVNREDVKPLCDFHIPAMVRRGDLLFTISTGGRSPGLASRLRRYLEDLFPPVWAARLERLAKERAAWRGEGIPLKELGRRTDALIEQEGWLP